MLTDELVGLPTTDEHGAMTHCEGCGYTYEDHGASGLAEAMRHEARVIRDELAALGRPGGLGVLRQRPAPTTWSALEYACHVRDVLLVQRDRVILALLSDNPGFAPMHRDERPALTHYNEEDPATTATEVTIAADLFARLVAPLTASQWARPCVYNSPAPTGVDLLWVGQHTLHELVHHRHDIATVLGTVAAFGS